MTTQQIQDNLTKELLETLDQTGEVPDINTIIEYLEDSFGAGELAVDMLRSILKGGK